MNICEFTLLCAPVSMHTVDEQTDLGHLEPRLTHMGYICIMGYVWCTHVALSKAAIGACRACSEML